MIEVLNWFDDRDRFIGAIVFMVVFFYGIAHVASAFRGRDDEL